MSLKNFCAKIIVSIKPTVKDIKGLTLKQGIESIVNIENLSCRVGSFYTLNFSAENIEKAEEYVHTIAKEILSNSVIETYEILSIADTDE